MSEQTIGQRRVRASFNPSDSNIVDIIKAKSAELIDLSQEVKATAKDGEQARCASLAQTAYEEAAMWLVKAATA